METFASSQDICLQSTNVPLTWVVICTLAFCHDEQATWDRDA